jgi:hypothetical protein
MGTQLPAKIQTVEQLSAALTIFYHPQTTPDIRKASYHLLFACQLFLFYDFFLLLAFVSLFHVCFSFVGAILFLMFSRLA